jgi:hypothetical protein
MHKTLAAGPHPIAPSHIVPCQQAVLGSHYADVLHSSLHCLGAAENVGNAQGCASRAKSRRERLSPRLLGQNKRLSASRPGDSTLILNFTELQRMQNLSSLHQRNQLSA